MTAADAYASTGPAAATASRLSVWRLEGATLLLHLDAASSEVSLVQSHALPLLLLQHVCAILARARPGAGGGGAAVLGGSGGGGSGGAAGGGARFGRQDRMYGAGDGLGVWALP